MSLYLSQTNDYEKFRGFRNSALEALEFKKPGVTIVRDRKSAD